MRSDSSIQCLIVLMRGEMEVEKGEEEMRTKITEIIAQS